MCEREIFSLKQFTFEFFLFLCFVGDLCMSTRTESATREVSLGYMNVHRFKVCSGLLGKSRFYFSIP